MSPGGRRGGGARSEDDRRRARLEREQRRAAREGRPVPRTVEDPPSPEPTAAAPAPADPGVADVPARDSAPDAPTPVAGRRAPSRSSAATDRPVASRPASEHPAPSRPAPAQTAPRGTTERTASEEPTGAGPGDREPVAVRPWWATAAGGDAPPMPPAGTARPVPNPGVVAPGRPADGAAGDPSASGEPSAGGARTPGRPRASSTGGDERGPFRAPGLLGPDPGSDPRDRPPVDEGRAGSRATDDWFAPDRPAEPVRADVPDGGHRREREETPALVPLRSGGPARPAGVALATAHTRTAPARRGVSRIAAFLVLVPFVVAVAAAVFLFEPFKGEGDGEVRVRIAPGSSMDDIGRLLQDRGVISNAFAFAVRARLSGDGANLKAGTLRLKRGMSYGAALTALQQDPLPPAVVRVAIPEGLSRSEIASSIKGSGVTGSYLTASARSAGFDPTDFGQPRSRSGLEGFLFPATYELQRGGATTKALVAEQLRSFRTNVAKVSMSRARRAGLSPYEVLIIASMVEREVRIPSERRLVAAVIWNRLDQDIALGIDATTRYAVKNWTRPLKQSEIDSETPYDTRYRKGLPPTPIGSPGLAAIRAAANPADVPYLYYVVKPCGDGKHAFASTDVEFQRDRAAYNAAQRRAGGDPSPSDAKGCGAG